MRAGLQVLALLTTLGGCAVRPAAVVERPSNIIIGGGMQHCSSMSAAPRPLCTAPWQEILQKDSAFAGMREQDVLFGPVPARVFTYHVTPASLRELESLPERLLKRQDQLRLSAALSPLAGKGTLSAAQFGALLQGYGGTVLAAASEVFVERQAEAPRPRQLRSIPYMANADSAAIYRAIVAAAAAASGKARPAIGVVTASADNPYNDHDIYISALTSAGADVVWLPLDGGLRRALDAGDCEHLAIDYSIYAQHGTGRQYLHMDQLFPDLHALRRSACADRGASLNRDLERIDGIFFTGGDQARHLDSLAGPLGPSAQLQIIRRRHAAGELVVAGSSAGDAVQAGGSWRGRPVPMIAGGESALALALGFAVAEQAVEEGSERKASYYPNGGLGLFHFGPLDSHFSQRGREGRLLRLVAVSGMDYGFGVDENTALMVGRTDPSGSTTMGVRGAGGVWVVDLRQARTSGAANAALSVRGARMHYLHAGDTLAVNGQGNLTVTLAERGHGGAGAVASAGPGARFRLSAQVEEMARRGTDEAEGTLEQQFTFTVRRAPGARMVRTERDQLSYAGLALDIVPCPGSCGGEQGPGRSSLR